MTKCGRNELGGICKFKRRKATVLSLPTTRSSCTHRISLMTMPAIGTKADPSCSALTANLRLLARRWGLGIRFPRLDADLYVPALLERVLGSKSWMAARLGAAGGQVRGGAKAAASRDNGRRGGTPRKVTTV
jgi:hypothetical protein